MRLLFDECLHESLVAMAHTAGIEASHVNYLGLSGRIDRELVHRIVEDDFTFVTNSRFDFISLFARLDIHPGLVIIVPNVTPSLQRALFEAALLHIGARDLTNRVV